MSQTTDEGLHKEYDLDIETNVREMFEAASKMIFKESIDNIEFELCINTLITAISYLQSKRRHKNDDEIVDEMPLLKGNNKLVTEFGSSQPVRFANPTNCFVRDENGDELMCACGKKSVILVAGKESFTAMCHACREKLYDKNE